MDRQNFLTTLLAIVVLVLAIPPAIEASLNLWARLASSPESGWRHRLRELMRPFTRPMPSWSVLLLIVLSMLVNSRMTSQEGTVRPANQDLAIREQTPTVVEIIEQTPLATQTSQFEQITPEVIETPTSVSTAETATMVTTAAAPSETPAIELCWMYAVHEGDTLPSIAQVIYEDQRQWPRICERNQPVLGHFSCTDTPPSVHRGQVLCVPVISPVKTYAVMANDNLEKIAGRFYGEYYDAPLAERICHDEANQDVIQGDCSSIRPGQVLSIRALDPVPSDSYLVAPGDSWRAIARGFYGTELKENDLRAANPEVQADSRGRVLPGQVISLPGLREPMHYTVVQGDTLETLASRCGFGPLGPDDIYLINRKVIGIDQRDLQPGQALTLYGCGF